MTASALLWFVVVVALIPGSLWVLRRGLPLGGAGGASSAPVRVIASTVLGPQQRLVTIETGEAGQKVWIVLGVSPQGIQPLHTMPAQPLPEAGATPASFGLMLERLRSGKAA